MSMNKRMRCVVFPVAITIASILPASAMAAVVSGNPATISVVKPAVINAPGGGSCSYYVARPGYTSYAYLGPKVRPPRVVAARFGATQEEINRDFSRVIESHFNSGMAERIVERLNDKELASLARLYQRNAGVQNTRLLKIFASRLSDQALLRVASAFGRNAVMQAVNKYSSPAVRESFVAKASAIIPLAVTPSEAMLTPMRRPGGLPLPPPSPSSTDWTNTVREIYLDYRTDAALDLTVTESLSATTIYTGFAVYGAWEAGSAVGDGVNSLIETYDPSLDDAIGGTVAGMLDAAHNAGTELEQGNIQASFDELFGYPITDSTQPFGPYGLTSPMVDYYDTYGAPTGFGGGGGDVGEPCPYPPPTDW